MIQVKRLLQHEWSELSETAHLICFGKHKPASQDRFDFALLAHSENGALGYVTCRELDADSVHWQFGGVFPGTRGSVKSLHVFRALRDHCAQHYQRIGFLVENGNHAMIKMALHFGMKIVGVRNFKGAVLLEHHLEFGET